MGYNIDDAVRGFARDYFNSICSLRERTARAEREAQARQRARPMTADEQLTMKLHDALTSAEVDRRCVQEPRRRREAIAYELVCDQNPDLVARAFGRRAVGALHLAEIGDIVDTGTERERHPDYPVSVRTTGLIDQGADEQRQAAAWRSEWRTRLKSLTDTGVSLAEATVRAAERWSDEDPSSYTRAARAGVFDVA